MEPPAIFYTNKTYIPLATLELAPFRHWAIILCLGYTTTQRVITDLQLKGNNTKPSINSLRGMMNDFHHFLLHFTYFIVITVQVSKASCDSLFTFMLKTKLNPHLPIWSPRYSHMTIWRHCISMLHSCVRFVKINWQASSFVTSYISLQNATCCQFGKHTRPVTNGFPLQKISHAVFSLLLT